MRVDKRHRRILGKMKNPKTANEIITACFNEDARKGSDFIVIERGWRYYVHLNKLFAPMERAGLIKQDGFKTGQSGTAEKVWIKL
jgi:hypothetical protein